MTTPLKPSELRANIFRILDQILETGVPVEIERHGQILRIVPDRPRSKLDNLVTRPDFMVGDPDDFVHIDWSSEWKP